MVDSSVPIRWKFTDFLEAHDLTVYQVAKLTEGRVSRNALYDLKNKAPSGINFETLEALIPALEELSGRTVELSDLVEYVRS